ncbi:MAG: hypothetical protein Kow002_02250 [Anaerolineales bacterium]
MNKKSKLKGVLEILLVIAFFLTACNTKAPQTNIVTPIVVMTRTATATVPVTASPQLTFQVAMTANPEQLERWQEYENALAERYLSYLSLEQVLCEWEILGQSEQKIFVWAICVGDPPDGYGDEYAPHAGMPAVIHIGLDGSVQRVEIPRDTGLTSNEGIRKLFPLDIQERIFQRMINFGALTDHAEWRRKNPGPPLIVLSATHQP